MRCPTGVGGQFGLTVPLNRVSIKGLVQGRLEVPDLIRAQGAGEIDAEFLPNIGADAGVNGSLAVEETLRPHSRRLRYLRSRQSFLDPGDLPSRLNPEYSR